MTKSIASLTHLIISLAVVSFVFLVIRFQLYPDFYFPIQGISEIILILFAVDVILGPLLTFIVFKPGKKSLKFDLSVIAFFQIAALSYGSYTIYNERPLSALLVGNSFEIQTASGYDLSKLDESKIDTSIFSSPKFHVFMATDEIKIALAVHSFTGSGSTDYLQDTELYFPINEQKERIKESALKLEYLAKVYPKLDVDVERFYYVRVIGKAGFGLVKIDKQNYEIIEVTSLTNFNMNPL